MNAPIKPDFDRLIVWPDTEQMIHFSEHVLPLIRSKEIRMEKAS